jgi:endonuclease YncB( thermonuclease family)
VKRLLRALFLLSVLCAGTFALAQSFAARVVTVIDGDTLIVAEGRRKATIRVADIDAPETAQPYGAASRQSLAELVVNKTLTVTPRVTDEYGRKVATVHADGVNVGEAQIARGMAWEYSHHHANRGLQAMQEAARRARRGLWAQAQPMPPWEFRKPSAVAHGTQGAPHACGKKHYCAQMTSCDEARYYFIQCHVKTLDRNGDGTPCENLCGNALRR